MYFPRFLVGASAALLIVVAWIYHATGSIWHALGWAIVAAVILQIGYFIAVASMIYLGASNRAEVGQSSADEAGSLPQRRDGIFTRLF